MYSNPHVFESSQTTRYQHQYNMERRGCYVQYQDSPDGWKFHGTGYYYIVVCHLGECLACYVPHLAFLKLIALLSFFHAYDLYYWCHNFETCLQLQTRRIRKGLKRVHRGSVQGVIGGTSTSSESEEEEEQNEGVYLGSLSVAETPEERKRRENRSRRFDRGKDMNRGSKGFGRGRITNGSIASTRRGAVLQMALNSGDSQNGRAVEDIDWDSLTVRGTCQEVEKRYLRLTSAPDPHMVAPPPSLPKFMCSLETYLCYSRRSCYLYILTEKMLCSRHMVTDCFICKCEILTCHCFFQLTLAAPI